MKTRRTNQTLLYTGERLYAGGLFVLLCTVGPTLCLERGNTVW